MAELKQQNSAPPSSLVRFLSGIISGVIAVTVCSPIDVMKTRMMIQGDSKIRKDRMYKGSVMDFVQRVYREEGLKGFYRGYTITVINVPLFHSLYFPIYEKMKHYLVEKRNFEPEAFSVYAVSAGVSGIFCNLVTNPFWLVRTRMQGEIFRTDGSIKMISQTEYRGMTRSILHIAEKLRKG